MKKIIALAALSAALSTSAFAAENNAYLTADLSSASYTNTSPLPNPTKIGIGAGYNITQNLAAEIGYHMFGDSTSNPSTLKVSSLTVAAVGSLPINPQFSAIGKLGFAMNKMDLTNTVGVPAISDSKNSLYYAIGGQFNFTPQVAIRAQYESFGDFTSKFKIPSAASAFGVAGVYNF